MPMERGSAYKNGAHRGERTRLGAAQAVERTLRAGAEYYDRSRDLPKLARLASLDLLADTIEGAEAILARLERALRAERTRARSGHWTYDLNRHIALRQAYLAETERLRTLKRTRGQARVST